MSQIWCDHLVIAVLLCCALAASAARPARREGAELQRGGALKIAEDDLARGLLGANAATSETAATTSTDNDPGRQQRVHRQRSSGATSRAAAASALRSVQKGVVSWARRQPAGSGAKTRGRGGHRPRRELPGATWTLYPLVGGGEDAAGTEFQDGEELERTGKAEGQLKATALASVDQKPYNAQEYAAQRAAAWERAVTGLE